MDLDDGSVGAAEPRPPWGSDRSYLTLARHYEGCFARHGDTYRGVDWPNEEDALVRHQVHLDLIPSGEGGSLLDFGCGLGHLVAAAEARGLAYEGLDVSPVFTELCRRKFPGRAFHCRDVLVEPLSETYDWIVANGVFTEKRELSDEQMTAFFRAVVKELFRASRRGLAFNVMSAEVDWTRSDLFHLSFDRLAHFLRAEVTPHWRFRADYGLREYTAYLYRAPNRLPDAGSFQAATS